jgi:prepilin-type processing-associated H-X9-DG protein
VTLDVFLCPGMSTPQDPRGVGSYAVCTGSGPARDAFKRVGHTLVPNPDSHNGAVIEPARGKTSIAAVNAADGARNTFLVGELDFGLVGADERSNGLISGGGSGRWAVAYPGVTLASTAGVYNAKQLITGFREWETFRSDHERGCNFVMVDGSVRFVTDDVDARVLDALATRDGDDDVPIELE